jgi:hypothetical protein
MPQQQNRRFDMPPLRNESWCTAQIAARLTGHTVPEVIAAVAANPETITEKVSLIGQKKFHLIARDEIIAHFRAVDAATEKQQATA